MKEIFVVRFSIEKYKNNKTFSRCFFPVLYSHLSLYAPLYYANTFFLYLLKKKKKKGNMKTLIKSYEEYIEFFECLKRKKKVCKLKMDLLFLGIIRFAIELDIYRKSNLELLASFRRKLNLINIHLLKLSWKKNVNK